MNEGDGVKLTPAHESGPVLLSVVIRCRNEAASLRTVMQILRAQRCAFPWEVIIVDNASEDETSEVAREFGARHIVLPKHEFTYGRAINVGFEAARGKLVLLLSAHAVPLGSSFLTKCAEPFDDPEMVAARCLFVNLREQTSEWYSPTVIQYTDSDEQDRVEAASLDWPGRYPYSTCGVYRRTAWERLKFNETIEGYEDALWGSQALRQGGKIYCCAEAFYMYTRDRTTLETIRRQRRLRIGMYRITGKPPMRWSTFFSRTLGALLTIPVVGAKHFAFSVLRYYGLVTIPFAARRESKVGSLSEYDQSGHQGPLN
jgi:rhamnosyltransferase